jgi:H+/Cl- antiporter ClcA
MGGQFSADRQVFADRVKESLQRAEGHAARLRTMNTRMLVSGVVTSAVATLVTGVTALGGPVVGEGIPGWRLACIVGAIFAFLSSLFVGLNQQLRVGDRLSQGTECAGRLRFLDLAIATGSREWDDITKEYEAILTTYPEVI